MGTVRRSALGAILVATGLLTLPTGAWAADGQIDEVTTDGGSVQALFSLRDLPKAQTADLSSIETTVDGEVQPAEAELASDAGTVERVTLLVIDVSQSMAGDRFTQAKTAALAFVDQAPADVQIGLVTFASGTEVVEEPTLDRDALRDAIGELSLTQRTELYAGVRTAVAALPADSQNSLLVLSDGRDTSGDDVSATLAAVKGSGARVDVVALEQTGGPLNILGSIASAGRGDITSADDPAALTAVFEAQAEVLASQVLVTFAVPDGWDGGDATVGVSLAAGRQTYTDEAFVAIPAVTAPIIDPDSSGTPVSAAAEPAAFTVSQPMMLGGIGAVGLGGLGVLLVMSGAFSSPKLASLDDRLAPYGEGANRFSKAGSAASGPGPGVKQQAIDATEKVLKGGSLDAKLGTKLDAGGLKLHAAEWLLMHAGIAIGAGLVGYVIGGNITIAVIALVVGAVLPYVYLSRKESKRIKAFSSQLADTLQLIAGSLSAGLSLAQSLDTVVREGNEPVSGEFRRALVEQRLGVNVDEALDGVAKRMKSDDFAWVVMAIRIQRDVGGNLSELLLTVANTLREREYLRRQVATLSAEGKLSAWILGGLPPTFFVYLVVSRPEYLQPMFDNTIGWMMLGAACVMMALGIFSMKKLVKVEV